MIGSSSQKSPFAVRDLRGAHDVHQCCLSFAIIQVMYPDEQCMNLVIVRLHVLRFEAIRQLVLRVGVGVVNFGVKDQKMPSSALWAVV
jgi:hypothetical protein